VTVRRRTTGAAWAGVVGAVVAAFAVFVAAFLGGVASAGTMIVTTCPAVSGGSVAVPVAFAAVAVGGASARAPTGATIRIARPSANAARSRIEVMIHGRAKIPQGQHDRAVQTRPSSRTFVEMDLTRLRAVLPALAATSAFSVLLGIMTASQSPATKMATIGFAAGILLLGATAALPLSTGRRVGVLLAWVGTLAPVGILEAKTVAEIAQGNGITAVGVGQELAAVACLCIGCALLQPQILPLTTAEKWLGLFLLAAAASSGWAESPPATLLKAIQLAIAYVLIITLVRTVPRPQLIRQLAAFVHLLLATVVIGVIVAPTTALHAVAGDVSSGTRLDGVYPYMASDIVGLVASCGIIFVLAGVGGGRLLATAPRRIAVVGAYALILGVAHSRTAFVILVVGLIALLSGTTKHRLRLFTFGPILGVLAILTFPSYSDVVTRYALRGQSTGSVQNLTGRLPLWTKAIDTWEQHPVQGYGYYSGHRLAAPLIADPTKQYSNLDSLWVETLIDLGLLGTVPLAIFVLTGIRDVWRRRGRDGAAPFAIVAMLTVASFVNPSLQQLTPILVIFAVTLLATGGPEPRRLHAD
jgi:O-antigen ligase